MLSQNKWDSQIHSIYNYQVTDTILVTENKMMSKRDSPYPQEAQTLKKNIIYTKCEYCEII